MLASTLDFSCLDIYNIEMGVREKKKNRQFVVLLICTSQGMPYDLASDKIYSTMRWKIHAWLFFSVIKYICHLANFFSFRSCGANAFFG